MFSEKDIILNNITMKDILMQYGIPISNNSYSCPFHDDKTPSAKAYKNSYYCFACGEGGDIIQFVQDLFHLDFINAMEKLNQDFNLKLDFHKKIDKEQLEKAKYEIEIKRKQKEDRINRHNKKLLELCIYIKSIEDTYKFLKDNINPYNWEENEEICSRLLQKLDKLEYEFDKINIKVI